jgi:hypothetical protein
LQILTPEPDSGRFGVLLDSGKELKVRKENLLLDEEASFEGLKGLKGGFLAGGGRKSNVDSPSASDPAKVKASPAVHSFFRLPT